MNSPLPFLILIALLLFVPILINGRKQKRQFQEMQQLQSSLSEGDVVTTTSGLRGTVVDSSYEETVDLEIAPGVVTTWLRAAVREKLKPAAETSGEHQEDGADHAAEQPAAAEPAADSRADSAPSAAAEPAGTPSTDQAPGRGA